jgi:diguanylate cyclase (GGDEF)-like protein
MVLLLCVTITVLSLYNLRSSGIKSAIHNAESISEVIKSGLTSHMVNNNMKEVDTFIQSVSNMKNVEKLWLVRSELVNKQFSNKSYNTPRDKIDEDVLKSGKMKYQIEENITKTLVRVSIPYNAIADKGIDCLKCHQVNQGDTLGAVSLVLDITMLKQIGIESLYMISGIIILSIILFILFSKKVLSPYVILFDIFKRNINQALIGKFKSITAPEGLSSEMINITNNYNDLISSFEETSSDIDRKLQGFIGYTTSNKNRNPLNESKDIINNLSNLYQFKKQVELDNSKEEIYTRLAQVFINKFNIKNFTFIEINMLSQKMEIVQKVGNSFYCEQTMKEHPVECRAARTKSDIMSIDYHNSCPYFDNTEKYHYCINIDIAKNLYLIVNCVCETKEELENLKDKTVFIKSYLTESAPALEVKLLMNALQESAFRDGLTGLYNRKFLEENSKKLIPQVLREGIKIGVLMLDMDHFKAVNDEYGHDIGDKVLKELARVLNETVRESDIIIRYGGEEFIILLVGVKTEEDALSVAQKIGKNIKENEIDVYASNKLRKTVSLGLSMFPDDSNSFDTLKMQTSHFTKLKIVEETKLLDLKKIKFQV